MTMQAEPLPTASPPCVEFALIDAAERFTACTAEAARAELLGLVTSGTAFIGFANGIAEVATVPRPLCNVVSSAISAAAPTIVAGLPPLLSAASVRDGMAHLQKIADTFGRSNSEALAAVGGPKAWRKAIDGAAHFHKALAGAERRRVASEADIAETRAAATKPKD